MNWLHFGHPEFLHFLWAVPPLTLLLLFGLRQKRRALLRFYSNGDPKHLRRHKIQAGLLLLSYLFLTLAMARPQWGAAPEPVAQRLDIMLGLDISTSMLAEDGTSVRRLTQAKAVIFSLLEEFEGDRFGLLYFAEASFVVCPLTNDTNTLREFLAAITADTLIHSGTRIGNAIEIATERLTSDQDSPTAIDRDDRGQKVLILFTDGEDHGAAAISAAKEANRVGVHVYCVGVGNPVQSVRIADFNPSRTFSWSSFKWAAQSLLIESTYFSTGNNFSCFVLVFCRWLMLNEMCPYFGQQPYSRFCQTGFV